MTQTTLDTSGFYKLDGGMVLYGPHFIINSNYELRRETKDLHQYPIDGWAWYVSESEAYAAFGITKDSSQ